MSRYVKHLYNDTCQACRIRLTIGARGYSEGAHIRPLGGVHDGPDELENVLCPCPNCHVLFDYGALTIDATLSIWINGKRQGTLASHPRHTIDLQHLAYQQEHCS